MNRLAILILLMTVVGAMGVVAGGQQGDKTDATTSANFNPTGYPIVKEKITLSYVTSKHRLSGDIEAMPLWKKYEEMTNVHLDAEIVPQSGWNEKRNLLLASGDLPHILGNLQDNDTVRYSKQGFFVPLNDLVDQHAPNIANLWKERPGVRKATTLPDGKVYSIARINEFRFREIPDLFHVNRSWMEKLGMPVPDDIDQYYAALKAVKNNDVNGNGDPNDEIPLSFVFDDVLQTEPWSLFGLFGTLDNPDHRMIKNGKVIFTPTMDEYRAAITWFAKLWDEGLIDQEVFTHNRKEYFAKGKAGDHAIYFSYFEWFGPTGVGPARYKEQYEAIIPMKGVTGERLWNRVENSYFSGKNWFTITSTNPAPEVSIRWVDGIYEPEFSLEWSRGPFGTALEKQADGSIAFIDAPEGMSYNEWRFANAPGGATAWAVLNDLYDIMKLDEDSTRKLKVQWPAYKPHLVKEAYPQAFFTEEESEELAILATDLDSYVQQMKAKWIVGEEDIDATWDGFQAQLKKMRVDDVVKIWQAALDRYNAGG